MHLPRLAKLRNAALLTVLLGVGATIVVSAPLMAGQGDAPKLAGVSDAVANDGSATDAAPPVEKKKSSKGTKKSKKKGKAEGKKGQKESSKGSKDAKESKHGTDVKSDAASSPELTGGFESEPLRGRTIDFEYDGHDGHSVALA